MHTHGSQASLPLYFRENSLNDLVPDASRRTVVDFPRLDEIWLFEHSKLGNSFMMKKPAKFS